MSEQLSLFDSHFEAQGFSHLCIGPHGNTEVKVSSRMRQGWRLSWQRLLPGMAPRIVLHVPEAILHAPRLIKNALLEWSLLSTKKVRLPKRETILEKRRLERRIHQWMQEDRFKETGLSEDANKQLKKDLVKNQKRQKKIQSVGNYQDLGPILAWVQSTFFENTIRFAIGWSKRQGGLSTHHTEKNGDGQSIHVISISKIYDQPDIPREVLGGIVYHECLHGIVPPHLSKGRRVVHGPEFKKREKAYPYYTQWMTWHNEVLPLSLTKMRIEQRRKSKARKSLH